MPGWGVSVFGGNMNIRKFRITKHQRVSLIRSLYKFSELVTAGIVLAGLIKEDTPWGIVALAMMVAATSFVVAFFMEGFDP
jgi:hypothetical protein